MGISFPRMVADILTECLRQASGTPKGKAGIFLGIHTFGDYLAYHPHIHCLATAGCFDAEGNFQLASQTSPKPFREAFPHGFLDAPVERKWVSVRQRLKLPGWKPTPDSAKLTTSQGRFLSRTD